MITQALAPEPLAKQAGLQNTMRRTNMKKLIILAIVALLAVALVGCNTNTMSTFWTMSSGIKSSLKDNSWEMSAKVANGNATRNIFMTQENLDALYIDNTNREGKVFLEFVLGDTVLSFDISSDYHGSIDTSEVPTGWLTIRLVCEQAKDWSLQMRW